MAVVEQGVRIVVRAVAGVVTIEEVRADRGGMDPGATAQDEIVPEDRDRPDKY